MEFAVKKSICKIIALGIAVLSAVSLISINHANAYNGGTVHPSNFIGYSTTMYGTYSDFQINSSTAILVAKNSNYYGAYKEVGFAVYQNVNGNLVPIGDVTDRDNSGTSYSVTSIPISYDENQCVRKYYWSRLHYASNQPSLIRESFSLDVNKY